MNTILRGIRNNNPGNLNFAHQAGAVMEPKTVTVIVPRFAKFATMDDGIKALIHQLCLYFGRGNNTVAGIIGVWAPTNENNTSAYAEYVARRLGVGLNSKLGLMPATVTVLADAIAHVECGQSVAPLAHIHYLATQVLGSVGV